MTALNGTTCSILLSALLTCCASTNPTLGEPRAPQAPEGSDGDSARETVVLGAALPLGPLVFSRDGEAFLRVDPRGRLSGPVWETTIDGGSPTITGWTDLGLFHEDGTFSSARGERRAQLLPDGTFSRAEGAPLPARIDAEGALHIEDRGLVIRLGPDGEVLGHREGIVIEGLTEETRRLALFVLLLDIVH
jgi:hypothetical protein